MKPVFQTEFGERGNCLQACVASLLELDLAAVPHWLDSPNWYPEFNNWCLNEYGLIPYTILARTHYPPPGVYCLAWGKSPRGLQHSVVYRYDEIVHDPHPNGGGLVKIEQYVMFVAALRVGLLPAHS